MHLQSLKLKIKLKLGNCGSTYCDFKAHQNNKKVLIITAHPYSLIVSRVMGNKESYLIYMLALLGDLYSPCKKSCLGDFRLKDTFQGGFYVCMLYC